MRHFLDISDFSGTELRAILRAGEEIKTRRRTPDAAGDRLLEGKVMSASASSAARR
jgi:ornithine carbamoyltransferase